LQRYDWETNRSSFEFWIVSIFASVCIMECNCIGSIEHQTSLPFIDIYIYIYTDNKTTESARQNTLSSQYELTRKYSRGFLETRKRPLLESMNVYFGFLNCVERNLHSRVLYIYIFFFLNSVKSIFDRFSGCRNDRLDFKTFFLLL